jgi:inner membrane protein
MKVTGKMLISSRCGIIPTLMLLFGHTGITLGAVWLARRAVIRTKPGTAGLDPPAAPPRKATHSPHIDYRFVLLGSLLPDILDKPIGQILFRETFSNGRIFAHTLVFLLLLSIAGLALYLRRGKSWLLLLSFGTAGHLIEDSIWRAPVTFLWPLLGWTFPAGDMTGWVRRILENLFTNSVVYIPELIGLAILVSAFVVLVRRRKFLAFILKGHSN